MGNTTEDYEQKARALNDARMASVSALAHAAAEADRANAQLLQAWADAEKAGWSRAELANIGFAAPRAQRPARSRTNRPRRAQQPAPTPPAEHPTDNT